MRRTLDDIAPLTEYDVDALWNSLSLERKVFLVRGNMGCFNMSESQARTFEFTAPLSLEDVCTAFLENKSVAVISRDAATIDKMMSDSIVERTEISMDATREVVTSKVTTMALDDYKAFDYDMSYKVDPMTLNSVLTKRARELGYSNHAVAERVVAETAVMVPSFVCAPCPYFPYPLALLLDDPRIGKSNPRYSGPYYIRWDGWTLDNSDDIDYMRHKIYDLCGIDYYSYESIVSRAKHYPSGRESARVDLKRPRDMTDVAVRALKIRKVCASNWSGNSIRLESGSEVALRDSWLDNFTLVSNLLGKHGLVLHQEGIRMPDTDACVVGFEEM